MEKATREVNIPAEEAPGDNTLPAVDHHSRAGGDRIAGVLRSRVEGGRRAVVGIDLPSRWWVG